MKNKNLMKLFIFCVLSLTLSSCVNITKRVHRNGYHIEWDIVNGKKNATIKNKTSIKTSFSSSSHSLESIDYKHFTKEKSTPNTVSGVFNSGQDFATQIDQEHRKTNSIKKTFALTETAPKSEENLSFKKLPKHSAPTNGVASGSTKIHKINKVIGKNIFSILFTFLS